MGTATTGVVRKPLRHGLHSRPLPVKGPHSADLVGLRPTVSPPENSGGRDRLWSALVRGPELVTACRDTGTQAHAAGGMVTEMSL